jgi:hypothetical protein
MWLDSYPRIWPRNVCQNFRRPPQEARKTIRPDIECRESRDDPRQPGNLLVTNAATHPCWSAHTFREYLRPCRSKPIRELHLQGTRQMDGPIFVLTSSAVNHVMIPASPAISSSQTPLHIPAGLPTPSANIYGLAKVNRFANYTCKEADRWMAPFCHPIHRWMAPIVHHFSILCSPILCVPHRTQKAARDFRAAF